MIGVLWPDVISIEGLRLDISGCLNLKADMALDK